MNKKLIATAVAATLAAPAAMAQVETYIRINNALDFFDPDGGDTTTDLRNVSSRFGFRATADLGNGNMAHGRYEFSTFTDREGSKLTLVDSDGDGQADSQFGSNTRGGINDTRIGTVGLSNDNWGRIDAGNQWSAYYQSVGTHMSPTYSLGYYLYSSIGGGPFRASNTVKYSNSWGPVSLELDTRFSQDSTLSGADVEKIGADNGEDFLDGFGVGLSFAITPTFSLAAAVDSELFDVGDDTDRLGLAFNFAINPMHRIAGGWQNIDTGAGGRDDDSAIVYYHGNNGGANSWSLGYGVGEEAGFDPSMVFLAFYHNWGGGFKSYFEAVALDGDSGPRGDANQLILGLRFDM